MALAKGPKVLQEEQCEGLRSLPSFRESVEEALTYYRHPALARSKLSEVDDAQSLVNKVQDTLTGRDEWILQLLRSVKIISIINPRTVSFATLYIDAMAKGINLTPDDPILDSLRKMEPKKIVVVMRSVQEVFDKGDEELGLPPGANIPQPHAKTMENLVSKAESLVAAAERKCEVLRSKYSGQTKVVRTTVIAQKVQLSHDSAALTEEDTAFTEVVDEFVELMRLESTIKDLKGSLFHEIWSYDSKAPYRDVFVPRPRGVYERALARPQDYLACSCCSGLEETSALAPATCVLYRLYQEGGSLINVADLWSAFYAVVGGDDEQEDGERMALAQFYRGLAELKCLGFLKGSKKKADHVAKLKWL
jgi:origin recognition complex subunit 3